MTGTISLCCCQASTGAEAFEHGCAHAIREMICTSCNALLLSAGIESHSAPSAATDNAMVCYRAKRWHSRTVGELHDSAARPQSPSTWGGVPVQPTLATIPPPSCSWIQRLPLLCLAVLSLSFLFFCSKLIPREAWSHFI